MSTKKTNKSEYDYEIDWELTGQLAIQSNAELQDKVEKLEEENRKLKSDLANIQCEFWFACEEIDYRKREDKELRKWIKEHVDYQTQADFRKRFEHK